MSEATLSDQRIRHLAGVRAAPVVTLYLDVYGRHRPAQLDLDHAFAHLQRAARRTASTLPLTVQTAVNSYLDRIGEHVAEGFDREAGVRGVLFVGADDQLEILELPVVVDDEVAIDERPSLRQLTRALDDLEDFAVLLTDRQRGRFLRFRLGNLVDERDVFDEIPRRGDATDPGGLMASHAQKHADDLAHRHAVRLADLAMELTRIWDARRIVLGGPAEAVGDLEGALHPYVRDRIAGRISVPVWSSAEDVRRAALLVEEQAERAGELALVARVRDGLGGRTTAGIEATLHALYETAVHVLLVSDDLHLSGVECRECGHLWRSGQECPSCGGPTDAAPDLVSRAIDAALAGGATVETCRVPELDELGGLGGILRF